MLLSELDAPKNIQGKATDDPRTQEYDSTNVNLVSNIMMEAGTALLAHKKGIKIYKGIKIHNIPDVVLTDPTKKERTSRNTSNHYTMLLDNLPSWDEWPKRSRSLICSTNFPYVVGDGNYGELYAVFPFNGAKIAQCPERDIWESFSKTFGININYSFNSVLDNCSISEDSYEDMLEDIAANNKYLGDNKRFPSSTRANPEAKKFWHTLGECNSVEDVQDVLDNTFNPYYNDFELVNSGATEKSFAQGREVWTESKCFMVRVNSDFYKQLVG